MKEIVCFLYIEYKDLVLSFIGVSLGGLITFFVSKWYYIKASKDLKIEASKLKNYNEILLRGMENANFFKRNVNEEGETIGLKHELKTNIIATSQVSSVNLNVNGEK